jgi:formylglycine-generating enzyme required for sulfatase activity
VELVKIAAGRFWMGSDPPEGNADEHPRRLAETGAYEIAIAPVTNADFAPFIADGYRARRFWSDEGWEWRESERIDRPRFWGDDAWQAYQQPAQPLVGASFYEAEAFARWLGMRLPTEQEWERAARGEDGRRYPWGDDWDPLRAHHRGGPRHTLPAGSFPLGRSLHGLVDCSGNVWEWCSDAYASGLRSARGGGWNAHPPQLRCASRNAWPPSARFSNLGFRVAR